MISVRSVVTLPVRAAVFHYQLFRFVIMLVGTPSRARTSYPFILGGMRGINATTFQPRNFRIFLKNQYIKVENRTLCCGNEGQPGC